MKKLRVGDSGFTLIEVMVTVSILSLATVYLAQSNLTSLNVYSRYTQRLALQTWADQRVWQAKQQVLEALIPETEKSDGVIEIHKHDYRWNLKVEATEDEDLYLISLNVTWNEGRQTAVLSRSSFVQKKKADS